MCVNITRLIDVAFVDRRSEDTRRSRHIIDDYSSRFDELTFLLLCELTVGLN